MIFSINKYLSLLKSDKYKSSEKINKFFDTYIIRTFDSNFLSVR